jgi:Fe-S-cluster containining protein
MDRDLPIYQEIVVQSQTDETARQYMEHMLGYLDAILKLDLEAFAETRTLPAKLFELWSAALDCYDRYIDHIIAAEGWRISCHRGCSACCEHELARGVTALEALNIYRHVRDWADIETLYEHAAQNMVTFQHLLAETMRADPRPLEPNDPRVTAAHLKYNRLQRPCAFLDREQGACRLYPVRPIVCRYFFNLAPAEWCSPEHSLPDTF